MGIHVAAATPDKYPFDEEVLNVVKQSCQDGASIQLTTDPLEAVKNADIIVTDTWYFLSQSLLLDTGSLPLTRLLSSHPLSKISLPPSFSASQFSSPSRLLCD